jgi:hypothetical protein
MSAKKYISKINKNGNDIYIKDVEAQQTKEDKTNVVVSTASDLPATLSVGTYYNISNTVSSLTLQLPVVSDNSHLSIIAVYFTTGSGTPSVNITSANSATISYFSGYAIKASTTYELNIMWNGTKWVVAYATIG